VLQMLRLALLFIFWLPLNVYAEELVAVVNLKFLKDTGDTAVNICFGEAHEDCSQWASFYLYEAKVKKVLSGEFPSNKFKVIYGRHALKKKNLKNVVVSLGELKESNEADYVVIERGWPRKMYCFSGEYNESNVKQITEGEHLKCFEEEH